MIARMGHGEIQVPEFQRKPGIWNLQRKSRLIESLLLRIPIPVFYFAADESDNWSVVDGLQRTTTIHEFVTGRFALLGLEYLTRYEGRRYDELERPMQRRIEETSLMVNVIQPGTPEEVHIQHLQPHQHRGNAALGARNSTMPFTKGRFSTS